jgi:hypothetical protein
MGGGTSTALSEHLEKLPEAERGKLIKLYSAKIAEGATEEEIIQGVGKHLTGGGMRNSAHTFSEADSDLKKDTEKPTQNVSEGIPGATASSVLKGARKKSNQMNLLLPRSSSKKGVVSSEHHRKNSGQGSRRSNRCSSPDDSSRTESSKNRSSHEPETYLLVEELQKRVVNLAKRNETLETQVKDLKVDNAGLKNHNDDLVSRLTAVDTAIDRANETERTHKAAVERLVKHIEALKGTNEELLKQVTQL